MRATICILYFGIPLDRYSSQSIIVLNLLFFLWVRQIFNNHPSKFAVGKPILVDVMFTTLGHGGWSKTRWDECCQQHWVLGCGDAVANVPRPGCIMECLVAQLPGVDWAHCVTRFRDWHEVVMLPLVLLLAVLVLEW